MTFDLPYMESISPDIAPPPRLVNGHPTFGYFGHMSKVGPDCLALWVRAVSAIPGARLYIKGTETSHEDHLAAHNEADVCLDTLPENGGIATLEALWMGRPVVSLHNEATLNGRIGRSILSRVGLPELSCDTEAEFITRCAELAQSKMRLPTRNLLKHSGILEKAAA